MRKTEELEFRKLDKDDVKAPPNPKPEARNSKPETLTPNP
jgi:hypothetical protein